MPSVYINRFDTWSDFIKMASNGKPNPKCGNQYSKHYGNGSFFGTNTYEEAVEHLTKGWLDGLRRLEEFKKQVPSDLFDVVMPIKEYLPEQKHDIAGGIPDIGAYITGATPETFITEKPPIDADPDKVQRGHKLVTIYYNVTFSAYVKTEAFFYRGAYVYHLIQHLERCGYSVELWTYEASTGDNIDQRNYVKAKEFGDMFDENRLAIALCSAFMLRRFVFSIQEQASDEEMVLPNACSYGFPTPIEAKSVKLPEDKNVDALVFTQIVSDKEQMEELFKKTLNEYLTTREED